MAPRSRSSRSWNVRDRNKVGSEEDKEQQEQKAHKNDLIFRTALLFACLPQGSSRIRISACYFQGLFANSSDEEKQKSPSYNSTVPVCIQIKVSTKPPKNDPRRQEAIASLGYFNSTGMVGG